MRAVIRCGYVWGRCHKDGDDEMTVIIGAIYDEGIVMLADRMNLLDEEGYSQIEPKIKCRGNMCAGFAGIVGFEEDFINISSDMNNWKEIWKKAKIKYSEIRWKLAVEDILRPIGCENIVDLNAIDDCELRSYYLQELKNFNLDLKILWGIYDDKPHLCAIGNPGIGGCFDDVGFYAIGAGEKEATMMLNFLEYRKDFNMEKAVFFAYLAKKAAEVSVGVDTHTDIFVINENGWKKLAEESYKKKYERLMIHIHSRGE